MALDIANMFLQLRKFGFATILVHQAHRMVETGTAKRDPLWGRVLASRAHLAFFQGRNVEAGEMHRAALAYYAELSGAWVDGADGLVRHRFSGAGCPPAARNLKRVQHSVFRADGRDVACTYKADGLTVSVFVTDRALVGTVAEELNGAVRVFLNRFGDAGRETFRGTVSAGALTGKGAEFEIEKFAVEEGLYVFQNQRHQIKFRVTRRTTAGGDARTLLDAVANVLVWPNG